VSYADLTTRLIKLTSLLNPLEFSQREDIASVSQGDEKILRIRNLNEARRSMISRGYRDRAAEQCWLTDCPHSAAKNLQTDPYMPFLSSCIHSLISDWIHLTRQSSITRVPLRFENATTRARTMLLAFNSRFLSRRSVAN